jgi:phosphatidylglycerol:prolipoprotein diacylglycerol transferase
MLTWNIDPVLLDLGPIEIRYYGVFFALSLFLAYLIARHLSKKERINLEELDALFIYLIIGLVVGARLGHIVFYNLDYYISNPFAILEVWHGGLASHGGAIGALLAISIFKLRHKKADLLKYLDITSIAATMPIAFVRLGNFFNSEIVGRPSDLPWAVTFPRVDEIARHPSQIYEFLIGLSLFAVLFTLWYKKHKKLKPGTIFALLLTLYFAARFAVEFVKEYPLHEWALNLTTGQLLSIPFFLIGCFLLWKKFSKN